MKVREEADGPRTEFANADAVLLQLVLVVIRIVGLPPRDATKQAANADE